MYVISACLCGFLCRYDGKGCGKDAFRRLLLSGRAVVVCPETLGGLPVPRDPSEILGGDGQRVLSSNAEIVDIKGRNVTQAYLKGARLALSIALLAGCDKAILKARSPACGLGSVYDGTFTGTKTPGDGVFAALLKNYGFNVYSDEEFENPP